MNTIVLPLTRDQARALERALKLADIHGEEADCNDFKLLQAKLAAAYAAAA